MLFSADYEITAGSCMSVKLVALRPGFTTLTVTYQYNDIILRAAVTVGAYHPLKVMHDLGLEMKQINGNLQHIQSGYNLGLILKGQYHREVSHFEPNKATIPFLQLVLQFGCDTSCMKNCLL